MTVQPTATVTLKSPEDSKFNARESPPHRGLVIRDDLMPSHDTQHYIVTFRQSYPSFFTSTLSIVSILCILSSNPSTLSCSMLLSGSATAIVS